MAGTSPAMTMEAVSPNLPMRHRFRANFQTGAQGLKMNVGVSTPLQVKQQLLQLKRAL